MSSSLIIRDALIADGSGNPAYTGSLYLEDGDIRHIIRQGESLPVAEREIDASGLTAAPGFIDTHSHNDIRTLIDPVVTPKLFQGITTDVLGQDGLSLAPCRGDFEEWNAYLKGFYGAADLKDLKAGDFVSTASYLKALEKTPQGSNKVYLVPHGNIRYSVMGGKSEPAVEADLVQMETLLRTELEQGGAGLSTGLIYPPCSFADTRELIRLCSVSAEFGRPFVVHQRSEADDILNSMEELFTIARESGVPLHISHFKICGFKNGRLLPEVLAMLDKAGSEGIRLSYDLYPYMAGSTSLSALLPPWTKTGGLPETLEHLKNWESRERIKTDLINGIPGWDNFVDFAGFDNIFLSSVKTEENQELCGKSLSEIASKRSVSPGDILLDILLEEECEAGMIDIYGDEEVLEALLKRPEANLCTDGLLTGTPHPRSYGAFPRFLEEMVGKRRLFSLEEGIRKMSGKGAEVFGLKNRGFVREGFAADLVLFDQKSIAEVGSFTNPKQHPDGIKHIFVNGREAAAEGRVLEKGCGCVIRTK
ncbi:MAG: D-aminoacylase [Spirochaetales bacterium]|nr:D-aminoacylase [Spirochaetales bacterium]